MNKTDKRQAIDEIYFLGTTNQHKKIFIKALKGAVTLESIENILDDKRKAYNFAYTNIFRKYHIEHDDLYGELDKVWNITLTVKSKSDQARRIAALATGAAGLGASAAVGAGVAALGGALVMAPLPLIPAIAVVRIVWVEYKVNKLWNRYKNNAKEFAERYLEAL